MANTRVRVKIPRNTAELLDLGKKVYDKHIADGADSPLNGMQDYNWTDTAPKLQQGLDLLQQADEHRKQAEKLQEQADQLVNDVRGSVTSSRDVLLGTYKKSPKKLGDHGYEVNDSPRASKAAKKA